MTVDDFTYETIDVEFGTVGLLLRCPDPECGWWSSFIYPTLDFMEQHAQRHIWERHGEAL